MSQTLRAHVALAVVALIYGLNYIIAKDVMNLGYLGPRGFILTRVVGASVLFWIFHRASKSSPILAKDILRLAACGFFGVAANQILFFEGLALTSPINASIIMTINPLLVLGLGVALGLEKFTFIRLVGVILGGIGALLLIYSSGLEGVSITGNSTGNLLVLLNATSYALYLVMVKPLMQRYSAIQVVKWVFLFGMLFVLPLGLGQATSAQWQDFPPSIWAAIAFVVIGTTFLAYLLNVFALKTVRSSTVGFYIYLQPFFASVFSLFLGKDQLDLFKIIAAVLIFIGVYLVSKRNK